VHRSGSPVSAVPPSAGHALPPFSDHRCPPSPMRSLSLHVSALNDDEYSLFTSSFADLVASDSPLTTDDDFDKHTVSVRVARAWLRGRYPDLSVSDLDQVTTSLSPSSATFLTTMT
jgi:hypothetical protein